MALEARQKAVCTLSQDVWGWVLSLFDIDRMAARPVDWAWLDLC